MMTLLSLQNKTKTRDSCSSLEPPHGDIVLIEKGSGLLGPWESGASTIVESHMCKYKQ